MTRKFIFLEFEREELKQVCNMAYEIRKWLTAFLL
jgi:hypothetical protein